MGGQKPGNVTVLVSYSIGCQVRSLLVARVVAWCRTAASAFSLKAMLTDLHLAVARACFSYTVACQPAFHSQPAGDFHAAAMPCAGLQLAAWKARRTDMPPLKQMSGGSSSSGNAS